MKFENYQISAQERNRRFFPCATGPQNGETTPFVRK
jgi:hypothetical protein